MSWITKLNEAYDCGISGSSDLIPIGFTRKEVKFHVILQADGTFDTADEFAPKTFLTVPTSPQAEARTGDNGTPFPLADQLKYLVCEEGQNNPRYTAYMKALTEWCSDSDAPECLRVLKHYLEQKTLLQDMTKLAGLTVKYGEGSNYGKDKDAKSMVIFSVHCEDGMDRLWERPDVRKSWGHRIAGIASARKELCYATGQILPLMESHPKVEGNAKLVSGKDADYPFVYKGRFCEDGSAAFVSYEAAAKAYNALDWLVEIQGFRKYGLTVVAWNTNGAKPPQPLEADGLAGDEEEDEAELPDTFEAYSKAVRNAALGLKNEMEGYDEKRTNEIVILGMEAATKGRMSVNYYQEIPVLQGEKNDYIARLEAWYLSCCWGKYNFKEGKEIIFTPTPHAIAETVMGTQSVKTADEDKKAEKSVTKQVRQLMLSLLCCITQGRPLPESMVKSAVERVIQPQRFHEVKDDSWSEALWRSNISTTCALIYKQQSDAGVQRFQGTALAENERDRSYLFGRLLAIADFVEYDASGRTFDRMTGAVTLMPLFVQRPNEIWMRIHSKLIPYLGKLKPVRADYYQDLFGAVEDLFLPEERCSNAPLDNVFLLGYYSQRQALYHLQYAPKPDGFIWSENRSELYGCMAAVAETVEIRASKGERCGRTNVLQYMNMLTRKPVETWAYLHERMIPYLKQLGSSSSEYRKLLESCEERFTEGERSRKMPLDSSFLHGYYVMHRALKENCCKLLESGKKFKPERREDLFGVLFGLEDRTERYVMDYIMKMPEKDFRLSNALQYISICAVTPMKGWNVLKAKLLPYQTKLPDGGRKVAEKIAALEDMLKQNGWNNDEPLAGVYLNYFYCG